MKNSNKAAEALCDNNVLERPRYFPRQLITTVEMTLEQKYFRDKLRRHNRFLHGWGVVCGAEVCYVPSPDSNGTEAWQVKIKPGYILGPYGDEIITCEHTVDLRTSGVTGVTGDPAIDAVDPWCSQGLMERGEGPVYVAVRYKEIMARPVRVQPVGCGCDDTQCEYSRWQDGYEIGILTGCPDSHTGDPPNIDPAQGPIPECPPCPTDPWVVLAKVEFDDNGTITKIDNHSCRRMVKSFGHFWWRAVDSRTAPGGRTREEIRAEFERLLDREAINRLEAEEGDAASLEATLLKGVTSNSTLGRKLDGEHMRIADIAGMEHLEFINRMLEGVASPPGGYDEQASETWLRATRVVELIRAWRGM